MNAEQHNDRNKSPDNDESQYVAASPSKRTLLRTAWVAPVVVATTLPRSGFAANISGTQARPKDASGGQPKGNNGNHFGQFKNGS